MYEVQRRTNILSSDWQAPFIPTEGKRRWRWVDENYNKHPHNSAVSRQASAEASSPPFEMPLGSQECVPWAVVKQPIGDEDGWQYAVGFNRAEDHWRATPAYHLVRRRVWQLQYEPDDGLISAFDR